MIKQIDKNTGMCMSLASRPGNFGCRFFNYIFGELDINFIYRATAPTDITDGLKAVRALNMRGTALSMPYKEEAIPLLDEIDPAAAAIGAVNTVVNTAGVLKGYNTDYLGVKQCLETVEADKTWSVILLGSGGMAKAVAFALNDMGFSNTTIVARNEDARVKMASQYGFAHVAYLDEMTADLLINATPVGMAPDPPTKMSFPEAAISASKCVMESVAEPVATALVRTARAQDKQTITGHDIILNQAIEQFKLYFDIELPLDLAQRAAAHARTP